MRLERASATPPPGLAEMLAELADGEHGFGGTPVHGGQATLAEFLQECCDMADARGVPPGYVPQTVFWVTGPEGHAIGMVRVRHSLNEGLRHHGGHIGYFIRRAERGLGYATKALRLALAELERLGEPRALLTVDSDNVASIRVIEANGGRFDSEGVDEDTGCAFRRYWIDVAPGQSTQG